MMYYNHMYQQYYRTYTATALSLSNYPNAELLPAMAAAAAAANNSGIPPDLTSLGSVLSGNNNTYDFPKHSRHVDLRGGRPKKYHRHESSNVSSHSPDEHRQHSHSRTFRSNRTNESSRSSAKDTIVKARVFKKGESSPVEAKKSEYISGESENSDHDHANNERFHDDDDNNSNNNNNNNSESEDDKSQHKSSRRVVHRRSTVESVSNKQKEESVHAEDSSKVVTSNTPDVVAVVNEDESKQSCSGGGNNEVSTTEVVSPNETESVEEGEAKDDDTYGEDSEENDGVLEESSSDENDADNSHETVMSSNQQRQKKRHSGSESKSKVQKASTSSSSNRIVKGEGRRRHVEVLSTDTLLPTSTEFEHERGALLPTPVDVDRRHPKFRNSGDLSLFPTTPHIPNVLEAAAIMSGLCPSLFPSVNPSVNLLNTLRCPPNPLDFAPPFCDLFNLPNPLEIQKQINSLKLNSHPLPDDSSESKSKLKSGRSKQESLKVKSGGDIRDIRCSAYKHYNSKSQRKQDDSSESESHSSSGSDYHASVVVRKSANRPLPSEKCLINGPKSKHSGKYSSSRKVKERIRKDEVVSGEQVFPRRGGKYISPDNITNPSETNCNKPVSRVPRGPRTPSSPPLSSQDEDDSVGTYSHYDLSRESCSRSAPNKTRRQNEITTSISGHCLTSSNSDEHSSTRRPTVCTNLQSTSNRSSKPRSSNHPNTRGLRARESRSSNCSRSSSSESTSRSGSCEASNINSTSVEKKSRNRSAYRHDITHSNVGNSYENTSPNQSSQFTHFRREDTGDSSDSSDQRSRALPAAYANPHHTDRYSSHSSDDNQPPPAVPSPRSSSCSSSSSSRSYRHIRSSSSIPPEDNKSQNISRSPSTCRSSSSQSQRVAGSASLNSRRQGFKPNSKLNNSDDRNRKSRSTKERNKLSASICGRSSDSGDDDDDDNVRERLDPARSYRKSSSNLKDISSEESSTLRRGDGDCSAVSEDESSSTDNRSAHRQSSNSRSRTRSRSPSSSSSNTSSRSTDRSYSNRRNRRVM
ncbi:unnamed protein product [Heterobilharzia americana]|nr:unnamed protein product [Heterobilharzia americana]